MKKYKIITGLIGFVLIVGIILTVFFWNKPLYDTKRVVERYGNVENYTRKITYREDGRRFNCEEYDEKGNIIRHISYDENENMEYGFECVYSDTGKIQSYIEYDEMGIIWKRIEYDINGNILRNIFYLDERGNIDYVDNFFNKYDEKGNLLVTEKYLEDNLMERTEYDNKGNTIKYVQYDLEGVVIDYWEAE